MILYYSTKFHFIIINSFRVIGRGNFPPFHHPTPPPQAKPPSKIPGGIGLSFQSNLNHGKDELWVADLVDTRRPQN